MLALGSLRLEGAGSLQVINYQLPNVAGEAYTAAFCAALSLLVEVGGEAHIKNGLVG